MAVPVLSNIDGANRVTTTTFGLLASTAVQAALEELDTEKVHLAGRSGGQTVIGGTAASELLTLKATAHATRGTLEFDDPVRVLPTSATYTAAFGAIRVPSTITLDSVNTNMSVLWHSGSVVYEQSGFAGFAGGVVRSQATWKNPSGEANSLGAQYLFYSGGTYQADTQSVTLAYIGLNDSAILNVINGGTLAVSLHETVRCSPTVSTGAAVTLLNGLHVLNPLGSGGTVTTLAAVEVDDLTRATTNLSLRSAGAAVQLRHAGPAVFGANAAPTNTTSVGLEVQSTTKAFLASRMTTTQRDALTAVDGMAVYNSTTATLQGRESGVWQSYAAIDGRAGGQTLIGGTGSGDNLTLNTTSHATKGAIKFAGGLVWYDQSTQRLSVNTLAAGEASLDVLSGSSATAVQLLSTAATNDDPIEEVIQDRVATTDATVTTIHTFAIPASTTMGISAWVVARRTGGVLGVIEDGAYYRKAACFKNVVGVATQIGTTSDMGTDHESQAGWNVTFAVSGANALLQVTGASQNNVTWHMTSRSHYVGT